MNPDELDREAETKIREAHKQREEVDNIKQQGEQFLETAQKMRKKAARLSDPGAGELYREADFLEGKVEAIPKKTAEMLQVADDLSREADKLRRKAAAIRDSENAQHIPMGKLKMNPSERKIP